MIIDGYCIPGTERDSHLPVDELLRQMDASNIERAVIAPEDRELAVDNISGNDRILRAAATHPNRLVPACGVNPWFGARAVGELERCVGQGARLLVLAPSLQGFIPTDEVICDLIDGASRLNVPVYVHTGPHGSGAPTQVVLVAERYPHTSFILGHCGSTDHAWDMPAILEHHQLENLWFELSLVRPWAAARYVSLAGSSKFIWGSSAPRNCPRFELDQFGRYLPLQQYPDVYGGNLAKLIDVESTPS